MSDKHITKINRWTNNNSSNNKTNPQEGEEKESRAKMVANDEKEGEGNRILFHASTYTKGERDRDKKIEYFSNDTRVKNTMRNSKMLPFTSSSSIVRQNSSYSINFMCFPSSFPYRRFISCVFECYTSPCWLWRRLGDTAIVLYSLSLSSVLSSNRRCVCVSLIFTLAKIENCCCRCLFDFILYRKLS